MKSNFPDFAFLPFSTISEGIIRIPKIITKIEAKTWIQKIDCQPPYCTKTPPNIGPVIAARPTVVAFAPSPFPLSLGGKIKTIIAIPVAILIAEPIPTIILPPINDEKSKDKALHNEPIPIIKAPIR